MEQFIPLNPKVKISDTDAMLLPLCSFDIVILVEPDPETWMVPYDDTSISELLKMYSELIIDDVIDDNEKHPFIIIAREDNEGMFFEPVAEFCDFIANNNDVEFDMLRIILSGIAKNYPTCNRIGIVGGVYEDEVARLANAVQSAGFDTTIVKRYCMSEKIFTNLDEMLRTMDEAVRKMILDEMGQRGTDNDFDAV